MAEKIIEVNVHDLLPGDILAASVYDSKGRILIVKNSKINEKAILHLKKNEIMSVYVFRNISKDEIAKIVSLKGIIVTEAEEIIDYTVKKFIKKDKKSEQIKTIIKNILDDDKVLSFISSLRILSRGIFDHSIKVAVLSGFIGKELKYEGDEIKDLCTAAMLHDIGMKEIPREIIEKPENLSAEEVRLIKKHPVFGYEILKQAKIFNEEICIAVMEHHERYDGTGYPLGIPNEKISKKSKIISVCDVFEALSSDRPYRKSFSTYDTVEYLLGTGDFYFNYEIVKALISTIVIYPFGQWVELSNNERGIIIDDGSEGFNMRPKVNIYFDSMGNEFSSPKEVDLSLRENINLYIKRII